MIVQYWILKFNAIDLSPVIADQYGDAAEDLHSPLLNIYLEAVHSEHIACEKSTKKWRDVLRVMSRHNVHIDVPWSLKRHNKGKLER